MSTGAERSSSAWGNVDPNTPSRPDPSASTPGEGDPIASPPSQVSASPSDDTAANADTDPTLQSSPSGDSTAGDADPDRPLPSGRHDMPRQAVVESQRRRLFRAMAEVCATQGYAAATVADVIAEAGVSRTTFYELFRDKEDCFIAALQGGVGGAITAVTGIYSPQKEVPQLVREATASFMQFLAADPATAAMAFLECRAAGPRSFEMYMSAARVMISLLENARQYCPENAPPPSTAGRAALGGAESIIRREIAAGNAAALPALAPELVYCLLVPYMGRDRARQEAAKAAPQGSDELDR